MFLLLKVVKYQRKFNTILDSSKNLAYLWAREYMHDGDPKVHTHITTKITKSSNYLLQEK